MGDEHEVHATETVRPSCPQPPVLLECAGEFSQQSYVCIEIYPDVKVHLVMIDVVGTVRLGSSFGLSSLPNHHLLYSRAYIPSIQSNG